METSRVVGIRGTPVQTVRVEGPRAGVVLVSEVFGIDRPLRGYAERLAGEGYDVAMPELWWRRGGPPSLATAEEVADAVGTLSDGQALADVAAARDVLAPERPRFVLGFCVGGLYARMAACALTGFTGAVEFYGRIVYSRITPAKPAQPLDLLPGLSCPLLSHFGEEDPVAPMHNVADLERRLAAQEQPWQVFTYPGCGHGFMNPERPAWDGEAAEVAWDRTLAFLDNLAE